MPPNTSTVNFYTITLEEVFADSSRIGGKGPSQEA
jgi:hypothetical protein